MKEIKSEEEWLIYQILQFIGDDPLREGLKETPKRVVKAWAEWFSGYSANPDNLLKTFNDGARDVDEMVMISDIPVISTCEHHMCPFIGLAHVAYIPNGKIVGLSKIPRLVDAFARRLQVQERLTVQIADCLMRNLQPLGVGVVITAQHFCMSTRGIKVHGVSTSTSSMQGSFRTKPETRAEFFSLIKK